MRFSVRLMAALVGVTAAVALVFAYFQAKAQTRALQNELESRAQALGATLQDRVEALLDAADPAALQSYLVQVENRDSLYGIIVYNDLGTELATTPSLSAALKRLPLAVTRAISENGGRGEFIRPGQAPLYLYALPLHHGPSVTGALGMFYDASYIDAGAARLWRTAFWTLLVEIFLIVLITFLFIRWSFAGTIGRMTLWMKQWRRGVTYAAPPLPDDDLFKPLAEEVRHITTMLAAARAAAEEEARLRQSAESLWTPERLRVHVQSKLQERPLFVVSNREPYMHVRNGKSVQAVVPASGLVTALEPVLLACDGTWIAHGAGDADRETVGPGDHLRVPPDNPHYTLRRVWLSSEENQGYYFGFANEGLWPLCHIAHTRPIFRSSDWEAYQNVNRKFARAAIAEMEGTDGPVVLVQDYHFALLPCLIKAERPDARVAIFWHIPWPNPQSFGICPWQRELLDGLLGADLIGFHIQAHCNYFLETVDQALESRIDWDRFVVNRRGHRTHVRRFPISVDPAELTAASGPVKSPPVDRVALLKEHGVDAVFMGVGVDRIDYTKGIPERLRGVERFLEKHPDYQGRFTFIQVAAPSRSEIPRYRDLTAEVEAEASRINTRFATPRWKPIVYLQRLHTHAEIARYYRAANLCMVTSLHDGMNLVAKEFVASRDDERGVLILSRFAGAAAELRDALIVNPYDTEQLAEAIRAALEMTPEEEATRMRAMHRVVTDHNIYRWAANLIAELTEIRAEEPQPVSAASNIAAGN